MISGEEIGSTFGDLDRIINYLSDCGDYPYLNSEDRFKYAIEIQRNMVLKKQTNILNEALGLDFPNHGEIPVLEGIVAELRTLNLKD